MHLTPRPASPGRLRLSLLLLLAALSGWAPGLVGQVPAPLNAPVPPEVREGVLELLNDPGTLRLLGDGRIPAGTSEDGDVGVEGGNLWVGGAIAG
ncbi:MAG: hypothetical protein EA352_04870, partial [Gemmatimonadales bacterium]